MLQFFTREFTHVIKFRFMFVNCHFVALSFNSSAFSRVPSSVEVKFLVLLELSVLQRYGEGFGMGQDQK